MTTNILVAGKSAANVQSVKAAVDKLDYQVIPAPSMSLALFLAHKNLPELILCDIELVDGTTHEFLAELQSDDQLRRIPFMIMTQSDVSQAETKQFMGEGAALILDSGSASQNLLATIEPYIEARLASKEERPAETPE
jgi:CheY-like chemotaxis protein